MVKKWMSIVFLVYIGFYVCFAQSKKRGMAYGHHSAKDLEVLAPQVSWWYNWAVVPESTVASVYKNYGFEFVPMTWNGAFDETALRNFLSNHPDIKYLLAFNEPNFIDQAKMTPTEAAAIWPTLEAIASDYNLEIVGPAVNFCGNCVQENGTTYTDPFKYLDDFFLACPSCKVDHIAVHCYMNTVSALQWYIGEFKKYGKPIWLTEFAGWEQNGNITNADDQVNYMIGAVDFLENEPSVFRYSWFIGRGNGITQYPYIDLLGADGQLTNLGQVYKNMPVHDVNHVIDIPAIIEAENYNTMSGILLEKTKDESGFANVGYIEAGDWLEYKINVTQSDNYLIKFRVAASKNSSLNVLVDGTPRLTQSFSTTGGWQIWSTFQNNIQLESGVHVIRLKAVTDGFNINWFQIGNVVTTYINKQEKVNTLYKIYPNPGNGQFTVVSEKEIAEFKVFDFNGKIVATVSYSDIIDLTFLPAGEYFITALNEKQGIINTSIISIQ